MAAYLIQIVAGDPARGDHHHQLFIVQIVPAARSIRPSPPSNRVRQRPAAAGR